MEISQKILSDLVVFNKYAKFIPELGRRETWEEICERNMVMHIRKFPQLKEEIKKVYREFVVPRKVLPSMRSMQFAGLPIELNNSRIFNCFSGDTKFITDNGVVNFADTVGKTVNVLNKNSEFVPAEVKYFGKQLTNVVTFKTKFRSNLRHTVEVTPNHRWILSDGTVTTNLSVGDKIPAIKSANNYDSQEYLDGFTHGVVFGDGSKCKGTIGDSSTRYSIRLCGEKTEVFDLITKSSNYKGVSYPPSYNGEPYITIISNTQLKEVPLNESNSVEYIKGFIDGWLYCDGWKKLHTESFVLDTQDSYAANWFIENAPLAGYIATGVTIATNSTNYGERSSPLNRISVRKDYDYFIVENIECNSEQEVFCVVEPKTQSFTLAGGLLTGNCAYAPVDHPFVFAEAMHMLLGGTGFGYSVQKHHVEQLPIVLGPSEKSRRFLIGDSIEGWGEAIKVLFKSYLQGKSYPNFDYRDIRPKGAALITAGGKAPGPDPLRICITQVKSILHNAIGRKLTTVECHDIMCHIADAVLSGGIRRAAMIAFFSHDDEDMIAAKSGSWWELNPQRGRANNSAVLDRNTITEEEFKVLWKKVELSGSGEPGVYFTNDRDILSNPCVS